MCVCVCKMQCVPDIGGRVFYFWFRLTRHVCFTFCRLLIGWFTWIILDGETVREEGCSRVERGGLAAWAMGRETMCIL